MISPEVDETGLTLAFQVTYRAESEDRCPGDWGADREAAARAVAAGAGDTFAVVDVNGTSHRLVDVGGHAASPDDLPCNETKFGSWSFGQVPPGPAQFHYLDNFAPVGFFVPEGPQAPSPAAAPDQD